VIDEPSATVKADVTVTIPPVKVHADDDKTSDDATNEVDVESVTKLLREKRPSDAKTLKPLANVREPPVTAR
jgi:hypothetical protein